MKIEITKIKEIYKETNRIKTFRTEMEVNAVPGQFVMVWLPGVDEKPLSLSHTRGSLGITVLAQGTFTNKMHELKVGSLVGIRGPFGRGFKISGEKLLIVSGGVGVAPLAPLAEEATKQGKNVTAIVGALTKSELLFVDRMEKAGARVLVSTDDGTAGTKGFTTDVMQELVKKESFDQCYTCGPEIMMYKVFEQARANKIPIEVSLERYIKCGIGICGQCVIDDAGMRVCKEGPTFRDVEVETGEFGRYKRNAAGAKVYFGVKKVGEKL